MPPTALRHRLIAFAGRPLVRSLLQVSAGNLVGNALNFIALAMISMSLDPGPRGLFSSMQAAMMLLAAFSDFGLNTTIIKYYRDLEDARRAQAAEALMRRALWLRLAVAGTMAGLAILLARPICGFWLDAPGAVPLFRLMCLGALGSAIWRYCQAAMQARQQFGWYALLTIANHALRLVLFIALILAGRMGVRPAIVVLMAVPFAGSLGASLLWPADFWRARIAADEMRGQMRALFHFSKWIFLSTIICSVIMRLDILMLGKLSTQQQVGQFGNANDLAQGFPLLAAALSTVLLPKLASTRRRGEMLRIMGYFLRATPLLAAGAGLVIVAAHLLIPFLRGGAYIPSIRVFDLLVIAFSISVVVSPLSFFCLAFERASWLTWMNLAQLAINFGLSLALIPPLGALGSGLATLVVRLFALVFLALAFRRLLAMAEP
jgi:O-antigen/teichoic acid export membrane protein